MWQVLGLPQDFLPFFRLERKKKFYTRAYLLVGGLSSEIHWQSTGKHKWKSGFVLRGVCVYVSADKRYTELIQNRSSQQPGLNANAKMGE